MVFLGSISWGSFPVLWILLGVTLGVKGLGFRVAIQGLVFYIYIFIYIYIYIYIYIFFFFFFWGGGGGCGLGFGV